MAILKVTSSKGGRPKEPIETRKARSKRPNQNRLGPPDVPMAEVFDMSAVPIEPPTAMTEQERECWDMITEQQRGAMNSRWIFRSDCAYLIATCRIYGRWMQVKRELDALVEERGGFSDEEGRVTQLLTKETDLAVKYQKSLQTLGLCPTRRHVSTENEKPVPDGLLAH